MLEDPHHDEISEPGNRAPPPPPPAAATAHLDKSLRLRLLDRLADGLLTIIIGFCGSFSQATDMHAATNHVHTIDDVAAAITDYRYVSIICMYMYICRRLEAIEIGIKTTTKKKNKNFRWVVIIML